MAELHACSIPAGVLALHSHMGGSRPILALLWRRVLQAQGFQLGPREQLPGRVVGCTGLLQLPCRVVKEEVPVLQRCPGSILSAADQSVLALIKPDIKHRSSVLAAVVHQSRRWSVDAQAGSAIQCL